MVFLVSCTNKNESEIIGCWYKLDNFIVTGNNDTIAREKEYPRPPHYYPFGFSIEENDSIKYFLGVWDKKDNKNTYIGDYRKYEIKDDSLIIFKQQGIVYRAYKFELKGSDSLILYSSNEHNVFVRFNNKVEKHFDLDSIKIKNGDGWGRDLEYKIYSNGEISLRDISYNNQERLDISKKGNLSIIQFRQVEELYNLADFSNLKNYGGCCDGNDYTITIYYNGIEKEIYDYMNSSPMKLVWANAKLIALIENELR